MVVINRIWWFISTSSVQFFISNVVNTQQIKLLSIWHEISCITYLNKFLVRKDTDQGGKT